MVIFRKRCDNTLCDNKFIVKWSHTCVLIGLQPYYTYEEDCDSFTYCKIVPKFHLKINTFFVLVFELKVSEINYPLGFMFTRQ